MKHPFGRWRSQVVILSVTDLDNEFGGHVAIFEPFYYSFWRIACITFLAPVGYPLVIVVTPSRECILMLFELWRSHRMCPQIWPSHGSSLYEWSSESVSLWCLYLVGWQTKFVLEYLVRIQSFVLWYCHSSRCDAQLTTHVEIRLTNSRLRFLLCC